MVTLGLGLSGFKVEDLVVSLNYSSQNGGNLYRAPYYNGNPNIGPRIIGNLDQYLFGVEDLGLRVLNFGFQGLAPFGFS